MDVEIAGVAGTPSFLKRTEEDGVAATQQADNYALWKNAGVAGSAATLTLYFKRTVKLCLECRGAIYRARKCFYLMKQVIPDFFNDVKRIEAVIQHGFLKMAKYDY